MDAPSLGSPHLKTKPNQTIDWEVGGAGMVVSNPIYKQSPWGPTAKTDRRFSP